jgi:glycosyltransferase involved in cell wall biosynthesis
LHGFPGNLRRVQPSRPLHGLKGHAWEQLVLPRKVRGRLLWSPSNTGPLAVSRQVVTIHDLAFLDVPATQADRFRRWYAFLVPRLAPRVRHVIVVSEFTKERLLRWVDLPPDRVSVIPNGVDHTLFHPRRAKTQNPYVLTVGTLEPRKNLANLLEAWRLAFSRLPGVEMRVVGGRGKSTVFAEQKLSAPPACTFLGRVADEELARLYAGAALVVVPSSYEGFGLPCLEAMACGAPLLYNDIPPFREVAGNAGVPVNATRPSALADAIVSLMRDDGLRKSLAGSAPARAREFRWERTARMTREVLEAHAG